MAVEDQMVSIWLASNGHLDDVPVEDIRRFEADMLEYLHQNAADVYEQIDGGVPLSDDSQQALVAKTTDFKRQFQTTNGTPVINEAPVDPLKEEDLKKNTITVSRKTAKQDK